MKVPYLVHNTPASIFFLFSPKQNHNYHSQKTSDILFFPLDFPIDLILFN